MDHPENSLPILLLIAWLLPLLSFVVICVGYSLPQLFGRRLSGKLSEPAAVIATLSIGTSCLLSLIALFGVWIPNHKLVEHHAAPHEYQEEHGHQEEQGQQEEHREAHAAAGSWDRLQAITSATVGEDALDFDGLAGAFRLVANAEPNSGHGPAEQGPEQHGTQEHGTQEHGTQEHGAEGQPVAYAGDWYLLAKFGGRRLTIGYYINALTVAMFAMVTFIATCIHVYSMGYMHDELHDYTDELVTLSNGEHLKRPGRYHRFFQYLSLFCFSMLGVVIAGNLAMVFVFWELVGICSYFLIGFYIERHSASTAANKAFIVNRVGDFGMIIGLMALFGSLGTLAFGDIDHDANGKIEATERGIFSLVRPAGQEHHHALVVPDGMLLAVAGPEVARVARDHAAQGGSPADTLAELESRIDAIRAAEDGRYERAAYWLLVVAGLGIFCGCVGKSAQFPLHVWLPDAMEGPTPVSALVHSATMVAAGVYLTGRFFPAFTPEVLWCIALVGLVTLLLAATIAVTATDIKRVLAYSTVSQLGYMMLALGVGGWMAGMFHLFTHAFFKSLLFLCSGSVIHAVHTNELPEMGGLLKKMPYTGWTMLVGCLAIIGASVPFLFGLSGYYSKDSILEQAYLYAQLNPTHSYFFYGAAGGTALTAFYMFRMWFLTFLGKPRNQHRYEHAHESPRTMTGPLVILAVMAVVFGGPLHDWAIVDFNELLEQARPAGTLATTEGGLLMPNLVVPNEHDSHAWAIKAPVTLIAFAAGLAGLLLAAVIYAWRKIDAEEIRQQFQPLYRLLIHKWWFDELYDWLFVRPTLWLARLASRLDLGVIDWLIDNTAAVCRKFSNTVVAKWGDGLVIDGSVDGLAHKTWDVGLALRRVQTGNLRQYVMFIAVGTIALSVVASFLWSLAAASGG